MSAAVSPKYQGRLARIVASLNKLCDDAKEEHPGANLYLANDTLHLMSGPSHDGNNGTPRRDRIIASATIYGSGGGDW